MATIPYGHSSYNGYYPVLWNDWADPLYMYSEPAFGSTKLLQIARYKLVHYISGYRDNGGYRWFFCRVHRSGYHTNSTWEVGWVPAVRLSDGLQVLKALGHYYTYYKGVYGEGPARVYHVRTITPGVCSNGEESASPYDYFEGSGIGDYAQGEVFNSEYNTKIVPYPGQENTPKPWLVCGRSYWWAAGGSRVNSPYLPCDVVFWETGMSGGDASPPYFRRFN